MITEKSRLWYFRFRGGAGALGPARFAEPVTERAARRHVRETWGFAARGERMHAEFWPTSEASVRQVAAAAMDHVRGSPLAMPD